VQKHDLGAQTADGSVEQRHGAAVGLCDRLCDGEA
jgi:hypothetical protein